MSDLADLFYRMRDRYLVGDPSPGIPDRDLCECFYRLSTRFLGPAFEQKRRIFKNNQLIIDLTGCVTWAPVRESEGFFEIDVAPKPKPAAWRWIIAVRSGLWNMKPLLDRSGVTDEQKEALWGDTVWDLFACDRDLARVTSRYTGLAAVAGWPVFAEIADRPVRVHETPLSWLQSRCAGVILSGDRADDQAWLRACEPGVIATKLRTAEALRKKMRRPVVDCPPVFVDD